jgi:hypothetical protein
MRPCGTTVTTRVQEQPPTQPKGGKTITNGISNSSEAGVDDPHVPDAVPANAPDGRASTATCGCDPVCEGLHDLLHERPQSRPPQDGALADPPQQPQPMLPGLEGC